MDINRYRPNTAIDTDIAKLLAASVGNAKAEALDTLIQTCNHEGFPSMWIAICDGAPVGVLRLDSQNRGRCTITHIATNPKWRGQGIGRKLIEFARDNLGFEQIEAETDDDALEFYKACGFVIEPLGKNKYCVKRYRCVLRV